jgi:hypothetical protein
VPPHGERPVLLGDVLGGEGQFELHQPEGRLDFGTRADTLGAVGDARVQPSLDGIRNPHTTSPVAVSKHQASSSTVTRWRLRSEEMATQRVWFLSWPYSQGTVYRYRESWSVLLRLLPKGRESRLADFTTGLMADLRKRRLEEGAAGATVNRDLVALQSFVNWAREERELFVPAFKIKKEREPQGRDHWLDADEIRKLRDASSEKWWVLFSLLV